ncbi:unnamed protein product [Schistosoma curassoni]|nr:unnamed protein product [Schistosoma curassoni]
MFQVIQKLKHTYLTMDYLSFCRGVLIGGLMGDCYGFVYEGSPAAKFTIPLELLQRSINGFDTKQLMYSDDTQMSLAILRSLKAKNSFDAEHLAKEFTTDYFENGLHRCYGGSIGRVFSSLRMANYKDPYAHAADLFNGTGSYGNGGAMRIAPAALYGLRYPKREFESPPLRSIVLSIGLGGDTDTIGCMATALAGGYIGIPVDSNSTISRNIITLCESYEEIEEYASWLSNKLQMS